MKQARVDALDADPSRWNIRSLKAVSSSGMMWGHANKERLLVHAPGAVLVDFLNSSEARGMGRALTSKGRAAQPARFKLGQNAFVIDDDNRPVAPGSGIRGRIAVRGGVPIAYYGDPVKSAATFPLIDGVRCAIPRRLRDGRGRRQHHAARPWLGEHQHRRREGVPGRSRGVHQAAAAGARRRGGGHARRALRRVRGRGGGTGGRAHDRPRRAEACAAAPRAVQGAAARVGARLTRTRTERKADYRALRERVVSWLQSGR